MNKHNKMFMKKKETMKYAKRRSVSIRETYTQLDLFDDKFTLIRYSIRE